MWDFLFRGFKKESRLLGELRISVNSVSSPRNASASGGEKDTEKEKSGGELSFYKPHMSIEDSTQKKTNYIKHKRQK